jgi:amidase
MSHTEWLLADRERARDRLQWAEFFDAFDVLLCPVTLVPAFEHLQEGTWSTRQLTVDGLTVPYHSLESWPALIGAAYLPSTSAPVGLTASGLPVGVQVVSPYLHDYRSIAVAEMLSELMDGYAVPPMASE